MVRPLQKRGWQFLIKLNTILQNNPAVILLGIYSTDLKTGPHKNPHLTVSSSIIYNLQKLGATNIDFNRWYSHTMKYYSAIKSYRLPIHATKWKILLSEMHIAK